MTAATQELSPSKTGTKKTHNSNLRRQRKRINQAVKLILCPMADEFAKTWDTMLTDVQQKIVAAKLTGDDLKSAQSVVLITINRAKTITRQMTTHAYDDAYVVEKIYGIKLKRVELEKKNENDPNEVAEFTQILMYLISWENFESAHDSWEPSAEVCDLDQMQDFLVHLTSVDSMNSKDGYIIQ